MRSQLPRQAPSASPPSVVSFPAMRRQLPRHAPSAAPPCDVILTAMRHPRPPSLPPSLPPSVPPSLPPAHPTARPPLLPPCPLLPCGAGHETRGTSRVPPPARSRSLMRCPHGARPVPPQPPCAPTTPLEPLPPPHTRQVDKPPSPPSRLHPRAPRHPAALPDASVPTARPATARRYSPLMCAHAKSWRRRTNCAGLRTDGPARPVQYRRPGPSGTVPTARPVRYRPGPPGSVHIVCLPEHAHDICMLDPEASQCKRLVRVCPVAPIPRRARAGPAPRGR